MLHEVRPYLLASLPQKYWISEMWANAESTSALLSPQAFQKCRLLAWSSAKQNTVLSHHRHAAIKPSAMRTQFKSLIELDIQYIDRPFDAAGAIWQVRLRLQIHSNISDCWCCPGVTTHCNLCQSPSAVVNEEGKEKRKLLKADKWQRFFRTYNNFTKSDSLQKLQKSGLPLMFLLKVIIFFYIWL